MSLLGAMVNLTLLLMSSPANEVNSLAFTLVVFQHPCKTRIIRIILEYVTDGGGDDHPGLLTLPHCEVYDSNELQRLRFTWTTPPQ